MFSKTIQQESLRKFLLSVLERCDKGTFEHCIRVGKICERLALELDYRKPEVSYITLAGLLHDVGKVFMPEMVNYPGKLDENERYMITYHPQLGVRFININWTDLPVEVNDGVILHHERLNGTGYPHNLKAVDITMTARIVAVADVFDAMSTKRPYRAALSKYDILRELSDPGYDQEVVFQLINKKNNIFDSFARY